MKSAVISNAKTEDLEAILALQKLAYLSEAALHDDYQIPPLTQTLEEIQSDFTQQTYLKATLDGRIIGSARGYMQGNTCYVGRLIVDPQYQNQGLGTQLLREIEALFDQAGRYELFTGTKSERNLHLYRREGYREYRRSPLSDEVELVFLQKAGTSNRGTSSDACGASCLEKAAKTYQSQSEQPSDRE